MTLRTRGASLRVRVMAVAALLVVLTSIVTGFLGTTLLRGYLLGRSDSQLQDFAKASTRILSRPHAPAGHSGQLPTQFLVEDVSATGTTTGPRGGPVLTAAQLREVGTILTTGSWRVLVEPLPGGKHVVVGYNLTDLNNTVGRLEVADAIAGAIALAILAGIGLPLVRASMAPLTRIEATAAAIAEGDLSRRIEHPSDATEVGRLSVSLNAMLATIESAYRARADGEARAVESEDRMRRFVADASHELRTPLTSVRGVAEYGLQQGGAASRDELLRLMALIQDESIRMGRLVEDLLLLARFDTGRPLDRRPVDLSSIAAEAVSRARMVYPGRRITLHADEPVIVRADDERVRQIIDNLVGNALQHTPDGAPVTVTATARDGCGQLTVADRGPGMTSEQASRVFERFYRTDGARTRATGGAGLGLAIAASLAAAHDGQLTVDTVPGDGAAFHLRLPLA